MNVNRGVAIALLAFGLATVHARWLEAQDAIAEPAFDLQSASLRKLGLHFSADAPSVLGVMRYQAGLTTHQELTMEWNLIPGSNLPVEKTEVPQGSLEGNFVLRARKQGLSGSARVSTLTLSDMTLVSVALTKRAEIRGIVIGPGSPLIRAEHRRLTGGHDFIRPRTTFELFLPDDPSITKLVFLMAHPDGDKYCLEQVGTLDLSGQSSPK